MLKRSVSALAIMAALAACTNQPLVQPREIVMQERLQTAYHWQVIAERTTGRVLRYSDGETGHFLGELINDPANLSVASGITLSPDRTKLFVTSSGNNTVFRYDYDYESGTATNRVEFANMAKGLVFPYDVEFSPNGQTIYVSNLGGTGVAQFDLDGNVVGPDRPAAPRSTRRPALRTRVVVYVRRSIPAERLPNSAIRSVRISAG